MLTTNVIRNVQDLANYPGLTDDMIVRFLYKHLDSFGDSAKAIRECLNYILSDELGKGGFILVAKKGDKLVGIVMMIKTGMHNFIPENFLVYAAVNPRYRNQGIGTKIIIEALDLAEGDTALHVQYENPAKSLYEKIGFNTKYAEMRYKK